MTRWLHALAAWMRRTLFAADAVQLTVGPDGWAQS